jgi:chromosome segregation ATPase
VVDGRFTGIEARLAAIERRSEEQFREILGHFDELYRRLGRLESEYFAIVQTLRRIEALVGSEQARRAVLEQGVVELRRQIADLQTRLDAVEARLQG